MPRRPGRRASRCSCSSRCARFSTSTASAPASCAPSRSATGTRTSRTSSSATTASSCCAGRRAGRWRRARTTCCARRACCARSQDTAARVPRVLGGVRRRRRSSARRSTSWSAIEGEVVTSALPPALDTPAERRRCGEELVDALVEVHARRLARLRPGGVHARRRMPTSRASCAASAGCGSTTARATVPAVEHVGAWLREHMPRSGAPTIVHGDYRLGNAMLSRSAPRARRGDLRLGAGDDRRPARGRRLPVRAVERARRPAARRLRAVRRDPRWRAFRRATSSSRATSSAAGGRPRDIRWYRVLALWKATIFMEGNYRRALAGTTDDPWLRGFGEGVVRARRARARADARRLTRATAGRRLSEPQAALCGLSLLSVVSP